MFLIKYIIIVKKYILKFLIANINSPKIINYL